EVKRAGGGRAEVGRAADAAIQVDGRRGDSVGVEIGAPGDVQGCAKVRYVAGEVGRAGGHIGLCGDAVSAGDGVCAVEENLIRVNRGAGLQRVGVELQKRTGCAGERARARAAAQEVQRARLQVDRVAVVEGQVEDRRARA